MRFQIEQKELQKHIQYLASVVPPKNTSPILNNYLLEANAETGTVAITATDLDVTAIAEFKALNVIEGGITAINARQFNEIVHYMPESIIEIYKYEELIRIQCSKINYSLLYADYTLFPEMPKKNLTNVRTINADLFQKMISKTSFAVSTDINRAVLNGVCWQIRPTSQLMAATDGRKVAEMIAYNSTFTEKKESLESGKEEVDNMLPIEEVGAKTASEASGEVVIEKIIPTKTMSFLQKILTPELKEIQVVIEPNRLMFCYGEYTIFSNIIEHKYPDYQKAFIRDLPSTLIISKDILKQAIKRIALLAPEENLRIRFELSTDKFEINTTNRDAGEAKEILDDYYFQGPATSISFNYKYMLSILDAVDSDKVKICLGSQKDPIMIYNETQPENQDITFLLMPLRS